MHSGPVATLENLAGYAAILGSGEEASGIAALDKVADFVAV